MAVFTKQPKKIAGTSTSGKLYQIDLDYLHQRVTAKDFKKIGEALRYYVHIGVTVERQKELGKDETMYAITKKQETVVHNGMIPLVEKLGQVEETITQELGHHSLTITDLAERISMIERQASRNATAINRLLEITTVCYGILRHYVLGLFVIRLTKTKFSDYAAGFKNRLGIFRTNVRSGNLLLEGDYEEMAEEFARGLSEATSVTMPTNDDDQARSQREQPVVTGQPFDIPHDFPK